MSDLQSATEVAACIVTALMLALQDEGFDEEQKSRIVENTTFYAERILKDISIPVSPPPRS